MNTSELIQKLQQIEEIKLLEANFGFGLENRIKIRVKNENDRLKWDYFIQRFYGTLEKIKVVNRFPELTFIFPLGSEALDLAIHNFANFLDRKFYMIECPPRDAMTIIAKVTNLCNLDCQYCYDKPFREKLGHNGIITMDRLEKAVEMASRHARNVTIIWHGGEPTLAKPSFYRKFYEEILPKYPYADYDISMQTNGTLLNEEWFQLGQDFDMDFGSSYAATMEDLRRTEEDNEMAKEGEDISKVIRNIEKAKNYGTGIGVIDVLTKENHHRIIDIYEFYKQVGINACFNEVHKSREALKNNLLFITREDIEAYAKTTDEYFTYWVNDQDDRHFTDRYASMYIQSILNGETGVCNMSGSCTYQWIGINSNGDIYPCDRPLSDKYRVGNVDQFNNMEDVYSTKKYINYVKERVHKLVTYCKKCEVYPYCKGGCPMKDIDEHETAGEPNRYACKMVKTDLMCAYKALHRTTIDTCNASMRRFLIDNCLYLPKEIPNLLKELGIADQFPELDYDVDKASFKSKEFEVFQAINCPDRNDYLVPDLEMSARYLGTYCGDRYVDNRIERTKELLKKRAERIEEQVKGCTKEKSELEILEEILAKQ